MTQPPDLALRAARAQAFFDSPIAPRCSPRRLWQILARLLRAGAV